VTVYTDDLHLVEGSIGRLIQMTAESNRDYRAMTLADLGDRLKSVPTDRGRRRLILEFVEEYRWEPIAQRLSLLEQRPALTGDSRYDAFLAALAEHLAYHDEFDAPDWVQDRDRFLEEWWFPIDLPAVRADALVHSPAAFRIHGIFLGSGALART
jgi:hypothetical protein